MKRVLYLALVIAAVALGAWWTHGRLAGLKSVKAIAPTAEVEVGPLRVTLPVNGILESSEETPVFAEVGGTIIELCENNAPVEPGDLMVALDTKYLIDQRDELNQKLADTGEALNKAEADGEVAVSQAEGEVAKSREALDLAKAKAVAQREKIAAQVAFAEGELTRAERELARDRRLEEMKYIAGTKLQETEKAYRRTEFALQQRRLEQADITRQTAEDIRQAESALELARHNFATAEEDRELSVDDASIAVADTQAKLAEVEQKIEQSRVVAPTSGLAVIDMNTENWPERRPYRIGDEVGQRHAPVTIYNVEKMQVRCQIGEMDISRVRNGQKAFVLSPVEPGRRYAAEVIAVEPEVGAWAAGGAPGERYPGEVVAVEELARDANIWEGGTPGKRVFGALVRLTESDPVHLRPGMTVDLEIILQDLRDVVTVPIRAVFDEKGRSFVYRRRGDGFEAVHVTTGTRGDLLIQVRSGVRPGDRVALVRPPAGQIVARGEAS
ncbi:MAG: hypothetical protein JSV65_02880 [Armatimonadota bacterium]|nr:MAG: hypothetical protein JSV65_02880 [Armatimonadota bacterium]